MKIIPFPGKILVKPEPVISTIILPENSKKEPFSGEVIESSVSYIHKGDHVMWEELTGTYVDEYILVDASKVWATYERG